MNAMNHILWQEITARLGWTLIHSLWQVAVIGAVLAILLRLLRRASASLRYLFASVALLLIALLPLLTAGSMSSPLVRAASPIAPAPASMTPTAPVAAKVSAPKPAAPPASATFKWWSNSRYWKQRGTELLESALPHLVSGWLVGVLALSVWQFGGWIRLQRLKHKSIRPVDAQLGSRLAELANVLGINRAVRLVESALVQVPMVVGWLRPMILLPASALTGLGPEQLEALLAHELAHIRRHDYVVNLLQTVIEILCFYHPAMWWVSRRVRIERENCCDDVAVRVSGDKVRYIKALASMEDLRAGQPELALAANGGSLLARVRRLVGRAPQENGPSTWTPVLALALMVVLMVPAALAWAEYVHDPATELERTVLRGFAENRDKFTCGALVWTRSSQREVPGLGPVDIRGDYRMWWDGQKVTTQYLTDRVCTGSKRSGESKVWIEKVEGSSVYDGGLLSRKPRPDGNENWLESVIRWRGRGSLDRQILDVRKFEHVTPTWSTVDVNGARLIELATRNLRSGESGLEYYDPAKGYGLVEEEYLTLQGRVRFRRVVKLQEVIPSGWFPVEVTMDSIDPNSQTVQSRQHLVLDLSQCRFNDRSALPDAVFDFLPKRQQDELSGILKEIAEGVPPDDAEDTVRAPRRVAESFIIAVMAGEYAKAAAFLHDRQSPDDLEEFRELAGGQDLRVIAVCADDQLALAITSAIRTDHGRTGPLALHLVHGASDEQADWRIDDIDVETVQKAGKDVEAFLNQHPEARMLFEE